MRRRRLLLVQWKWLHRVNYGLGMTRDIILLSASYFRKEQCDSASTGLDSGVITSRGVESKVIDSLVCHIAGPASNIRSLANR